MKFIAEIMVMVAFIAAFIYAVSLIFGKKSPEKQTPLEDLDKKADAIVKERDDVAAQAEELEKKASSIKDKIKK